MVRKSLFQRHIPIMSHAEPYLLYGLKHDLEDGLDYGREVYTSVGRPLGP